MSYGLTFVRSPHLNIGDGLFLPHADIVGQIYAHLQSQMADRRNLTAYTPNLADVDFFLMRSGSSFALFISKEKAGHLPAWGFNGEHLSSHMIKDEELFAGITVAEDISESRLATQVFQEGGMTPGPAIFGKYPDGNSDEAKQIQSSVTENCATLLLDWAERRRHLVEEARIFLSHKTIDKTIVTPVYNTLRLLGLNPWLDVVDGRRGQPLVRELDSGVSMSAMTVFFITSAFVDDSLLGVEIDRALDMKTRNPEFQLLPLVLTDHGGTSEKVPEPLNLRIWANVTDAEIMHAILRDLPQSLQPLVRFDVAKL